MKRLKIIHLLFVVLMTVLIFLNGCQASKLTTTGTLPESKHWEIVVGTVLIGGMVILFYSDIEKNKD